MTASHAPGRVILAIRARDLRPGDLVVDTSGERQYAAFDVGPAGSDGSHVRVWTAIADQEAGLADRLLLDGDRELLVSRKGEPIEVVHLMSDDLLDACETAPRGFGLHLAPFTTPERITCPACRPLIEEERRRTVDTDHAAARPAHVPASVPDAEVDRYLDAYPFPDA